MPEPQEPPPASDPDPVVEAYKKNVDRSLIRQNLRLTVQERFDKLEQMGAFAQDLRQAVRKAKDGK